MAKKEFVGQVINSENSDNPLADAMKKMQANRAEFKKVETDDVKTKSLGAAGKDDPKIFKKSEQNPDTFVFPEAVVAEMVKNKKNPEEVKAKLAEYAAEITLLFMEGKKTATDMNLAEVVAAFCNSKKGLKGLGKAYNKFLQGKLGNVPADSEEEPAIAKEGVKEDVAENVPPPAVPATPAGGQGGTTEPTAEKNGPAAQLVREAKDKIFGRLDKIADEIGIAVSEAALKKIEALLVRAFENNLLVKNREIAKKYPEADKVEIDSEVRDVNGEIKARIKILQREIKQRQAKIILEKKEQASKSLSEADFAAGLAGVANEAEQLLAYLDDKDSVRIMGDKNSTAKFPQSTVYVVNKSRVAEILAGQGDVRDIKIPALREKIRAILGLTEDGGQSEQFLKRQRYIENTKRRQLDVLQNLEATMILRVESYNDDLAKINKKIEECRIKPASVRRDKLNSQEKEQVTTLLAEANREIEEKIQAVQRKIEAFAEANSAELAAQSEQGGAAGQARRDSIDAQLEQNFTNNLAKQSVEFINVALNGGKINWGKKPITEIMAELKGLLQAAWAEVLAESEYREKSKQISDAALEQVDYLFGLERKVVGSISAKMSPADAKAEFVKSLREKLGLNATEDKTAAEGGTEEPYQELTPEEERERFSSEGAEYLKKLIANREVWAGFNEEQEKDACQIMLEVHLKKIQDYTEFLRTEPDSFIKYLAEKIINKKI